MTGPTRSLRATMRLLLAALLVLAGLAGARMQGQMGAGTALAATLGGVLCSGEMTPAGENGGIPQEHAQHCMLCNLPVADAPPAFAAPQRPAGFGAIEYSALSPRLAAQHRLPYRSRGPPLFG